VADKRVMAAASKTSKGRKRSDPGTVLVVHGPNLNLLGSREPELYGSATLADIDSALGVLAGELGLAIESFQSNSEGELVTALQSARGRVAGVLVNAAAYTHTSVAIRDAVLTLELPVIEVHLSNIHRREEFRHKSLLSDVVGGVVLGFGMDSYLLALRGLAGILAD